ncbi:L-histidine N(alpha)-methyltransferase [Bacteroidota bacterium]
MNSFAKDVSEGLSSKPKYLLSKYFYDKLGDKIFQDIMNMKEYYPTDCEYEILSNNKNSLLQLFSTNDNAFNLVELGAGDGFKTKVLLKFKLKALVMPHLSRLIFPKMQSINLFLIFRNNYLN